MPRWLLGVLGALAGYAIFLAASLAFFRVTGHSAQQPQPGWFIALTAVFSILVAVLSGYTAAKIGGYNAGFATGIIIFVLALLTALTSPASAHWLQTTTLVTACPATVIGARLGRRGGF